MMELVLEENAKTMYIDELEELGLGEADYPFLEWLRDNQIELK